MPPVWNGYMQELPDQRGGLMEPPTPAGRPSDWYTGYVPDTFAPSAVQQQLGILATPSRTNPMLSSAAARSRNTYLGAGYNPAAAEQAARLTKNRGWAALTGLSDDYWRSLYTLGGALDRQRRGVKTTTSGAAFLRGMFG